MNRFISLVKVNLKVALNRSGQNLSGKKKNKAWTKIGYGLLYLLLMGMFFFMGRTAIQAYPEGSQSALFYSPAIIRMSVLFMLFTIIAMIPATLFFAEDTRAYIAMPISASDLIMAKIVTLIAQSYLTIGMVSLPMVLGALSVSFSLAELLTWLYLLLIIPLVPVGFLTVFFLFILKVLPFMRNQKRLTAISGFATIVFALFMGMMSSMMNVEGMEAGAGYNGTAIMGMALPAWTNWIMPIFKFGPQCFSAEFKDAGMAFLIITAVSILWFELAVLLSEKLYFPILNSMVEESKGKQMSRSAMLASGKKSNDAFMSFFKRELKTIFRTPAYILNGLMGPVIVLAIVVFSAFMGLSRGGMESIGFLREAAALMYEDPELTLRTSLLGGVLISSILSLNSIANTIMTRDAQHFDFLKTIPVKGSSIIFGKFFGAALPGFLIILIAIIPIFFLIPLDPLFHISFILTLVISSYSITLMGTFVDIISPKRDWMSENQAMRNNKNTFISIVLNYAIMGFYIFVMIRGEILGLSQLSLLIMGFLLICLVGLGLSLYILKNGDRIISKL